jgi:hypothetical protein
MVGDTPVTGRVRDVSIADIREAIAADVISHGPPVEIRVINSNEIHLYNIRRYGTRRLAISSSSASAESSDMQAGLSSLRK